MKISSMFEFAFGKEVNYGNQINTLPYMTTLDFTKDVEGYGFAIRDGVDADLSDIKYILLSICFSTKQTLQGVIEFKTVDTGNASYHTKNLNLLSPATPYYIPDLASPLKEIVFWFPKETNRYSGEICTEIKEFDMF